MADQKTIEYYDQFAEKYHERNAQTIWSKEYLIFKKLLGEGKNVLDIGCGTGRDAEELIKLGFNYTGVDASEGMLGLAKELVPQGKFLVDDFFKLRFPNASFDSFWAAASFLHVTKVDIHKVLSEAKRILKHEGIGFISMKEKTEIDEGFVKQRYFSFYTQNEFSEILERNRLRILNKTIEVEADPQAARWLGFFVEKA